MTLVLDINSRSENELERQLSNDASHGGFVFDGCECSSIAGLLQGCKAPDPDVQRRIYFMDPREAHRLYKGTHDVLWRKNNFLYRGHVRFHRVSPEHHAFVSEVFDACFEQCASYRDTLEASIGYDLRHTAGTFDFTKTVLTVPEFLGQLYRLQTRFVR